MNSEMQQYIQPSPTIDFDNITVAKFAGENSGVSADQREQAVSLYYAVRDSIRYDPYSMNLSIEGLRASTTLSTWKGLVCRQGNPSCCMLPVFRDSRPSRFCRCSKPPDYCAPSGDYENRRLLLAWLYLDLPGRTLDQSDPRL